MKFKWKYIWLFLLFLIALFYRYYGIKLNTPFWVDEFYTVSQARLVQIYGLSVFNQPNIYFEFHNIPTHFLVAAFFNLFGRQEWVARLPFVLIGSLVPIGVFILTKLLFNLPTAISAALLTTFSYFEITWSRQARGYVLQQLLVMLSFYLYFIWLSKNKNKSIPLLSLLAVLFLGFLTHSTFIILLISLGIHFIYTRRTELKKLFKKPLFLIIFPIFFFI